MVALYLHSHVVALYFCIPTRFLAIFNPNYLTIKHSLKLFFVYLCGAYIELNTKGEKRLVCPFPKQASY